MKESLDWQSFTACGTLLWKANGSTWYPATAQQPSVTTLYTCTGQAYIPPASAHRRVIPRTGVGCTGQAQHRRPGARLRTGAHCLFTASSVACVGWPFASLTWVRAYVQGGGSGTITVCTHAMRAPALPQTSPKRR